jgi:hypothetical protein
MAHSFLSISTKTTVMPNQGNKSKGQAGIVQKKKSSTVPSKEKQATEVNAAKHSNGADGQKGDTGSSANKESKKTSGSSGND